MAIRLKYDVNKDNRVIKIKDSVDPTTDDTPDAIYITDRDFREKIPFISNWKLCLEKLKEKFPYLKVSGGKVVEMSQTEKDAVNAEIQAAIDATKEAQEDIDKLEKGLKALAILIFKEINRLRTNAGLFEYTWAQFKQAFKNEWKNIA